MVMGKRPDKCCEEYDPCRQEIVIRAASMSRAEAALSLFVDALELLSGPWKVHPRLVPHDDVERKISGQFSVHDSVGFSTSNFDIAALLAARASRNKRFSYALALYSVSAHNHVNDPMEFEPANFPYKSRSQTHRDQVRFAYAIIASYAVVEQLKLVPEKDSFDRGLWREDKRKILEQKLTDAGVDISKLVMWHVRGGKTRLELNRPPKIVKMCSWAHWQLRDCEIEMVDAIADLRALRSQVAAHDIKNQAKNLSVHDVANAQSVARQLILDSMGFNRVKIDAIVNGRRIGRRNFRQWENRTQRFRVPKRTRKDIEL